MAKDKKSYLSKSIAELKKDLAGLYSDVQKNQLAIASHRSNKTDIIKIQKREIARIKTAIRMKEVENV